jgi:processive 1,2-diacylglycerol beta-glucosyltransferase
MTDKAKKIFILFSTEDSGHHTAAISLKKAFTAVDEKLKIALINTFRHLSPALQGVMHRIYINILKISSKVYDRIWGSQVFYRKINPINKLFIHAAYRKFKNLYDKDKPAAVICTQAVPCAIFSMIKDKSKERFGLFAVITDYDIHSFWILNNVDHYFVSTCEVKDKLIDNGITSERISVSGIPVDPDIVRLSKSSNKKYGEGDRDKTINIMLMAGSMGVGPLDKLACGIDKIDRNFSLTVICGSNVKVKNKLDKISSKFIHSIRVYGYSNDVLSLMSQSDLLITKPGGLTISEALAMNIPMIMFSSVGGQETRNLNYLIKNKAALKADSYKILKDLVTRYIDEEQLRNSLLSGVKKIAKPQAAIDVVEKVLKSI